MKKLLMLSTVLAAAALGSPPLAFAQEAAAQPTTQPTAQADAVATPAPAATEAPAASDRIDELERRIDVLAQEMSGTFAQDISEYADGRYGIFGAAAKVYGGDGVSIGGYGELEYTNPFARDDSDNPSGAADEIDLHRLVMYLGYKFEDNWVLNTEIEFEHIEELSVEFAYLDRLIRDEINIRAGVVLMPVGIVNENHDPVSFASAKRPEVERVLIPTTWREAGLGVYGKTDYISYRAYLVSSLNALGFSAGSGLRGGRQHAGEAVSETFGAVSRADFIGVDGLTAGVSGYYGRADHKDAAFNGEMVNVGLVDAHADFRYEGVFARALAVYTTVKNADVLNAALGITEPADAKKGVGAASAGGYIEVGADVLELLKEFDHSLELFGRYEVIRMQQEVAEGYKVDPSKKTDILTVGASYSPIDEIAFKVDYQDWSNEADSGVDRVNVTLGFIF